MLQSINFMAAYIADTKYIPNNTDAYDYLAISSLYLVPSSRLTITKSKSNVSLSHVSNTHTRSLLIVIVLVHFVPSTSLVVSTVILVTSSVLFIIFRHLTLLAEK